MKVGILTFHRAHNLGAILQAYALEAYINSELCEAEIIDFYPNNAIPRKNTLTYKILKTGRKILSGEKYKSRTKKERRMVSFMDHYVVSSQKYYGDSGIKENPPIYDVLISGGDQILNQTLSGNSESYYLTFDDNIRKISYSSSFGRTQLSHEEEKLIQDELPKFNRIGCREASGARIIETLTGLKAQIVVDPVFLLNADQWTKVSSDIMIQEPYIFVYAMEITDQLINAVNHAKNKYGFSTVVVNGSNVDYNFGGIVDNECGPAELITYIRKAEVVVTNSFHGLAFSILFEKKIYAVAHSIRNARIEDLLGCIHFGSKLIGWESDETEMETIDGMVAHANMNPFIECSKEYLKAAIFNEPWENQNFEIEKCLTIANVIKTKACSYCRSCIQICPSGAISIIQDEAGNRYPKISTDKCVSCGLCAKACFNMNPCRVNIPSSGYAVRINDQKALAQSTSGGVFTALSDRILENNGLVFGAAFNLNWQCRHIVAPNKNERNRMRGAKYLQSDIGDAYDQVAQALQKNVKVLFSGTPCQIAGIKKFLETKRVNQDNLLLVDIVCHGVSSQKYLDKHVQYLTDKYGSNIKDYKFRAKEVGWHGYNVRVVFEDGRTLLNNVDANGYAELYFRSLLMRESCLRCQFSSVSRVGDITIGDFWNIDKITDRYNDDKGVSSVFVNTEKGRECLSSIQSVIQITEYPIEKCLQPNLLQPAKASPEVELFSRDIKKYGFDYCVKHYTDCAIVGYIGRRYRRVRRKIERLLK